jgi:hypothetical protein
MSETTLNETIALVFPTAGSRGRNGPFTATAVHVRNVPEGIPFADSPASIRVEANSRRTTGRAPLTLSLSPTDAILLADALRAAAVATLPVVDIPEAEEGEGNRAI